MACIGLQDDKLMEEKKFHFKPEIHCKESSLQHCEEINETHWTLVPVPTYSGRDLKIHSELVTAGLSAISIRHTPNGLHLTKGGNKGLNNAITNSINGANSLMCHQLFCIPGLIQPRYSFHDLHHPELLKLKWINKIIPEDRRKAIEKVFLKHAKPICRSCWPFLIDQPDESRDQNIVQGGPINYDSKGKISRTNATPDSGGTATKFVVKILAEIIASHFSKPTVDMQPILIRSLTVLNYEL